MLVIGSLAPSAAAPVAPTAASLAHGSDFEAIYRLNRAAPVGSRGGDESGLADDSPKPPGGATALQDGSRATAAADETSGRHRPASPDEGGGGTDRPGGHAPSHGTLGIAAIPSREPDDTRSDARPRADDPATTEEPPATRGYPADVRSGDASPPDTRSADAPATASTDPVSAALASPVPMSATPRPEPSRPEDAFARPALATAAARTAADPARAAFDGRIMAWQGSDGGATEAGAQTVRDRSGTADSAQRPAVPAPAPAVNTGATGAAGTGMPTVATQPLPAAKGVPVAAAAPAPAAAPPAPPTGAGVGDIHQPVQVTLAGFAAAFPSPVGNRATLTTMSLPATGTLSRSGGASEATEPPPGEDRAGARPASEPREARPAPVATAATAAEAAPAQHHLADGPEAGWLLPQADGGQGPSAAPETIARLATQLAGMLASPTGGAEAGARGAPHGAPSPALLPEHASHEIALDPVELGRVGIRYTGDGDVPVLHLTVDRPETLDLMRRHLDMLQAILRDLGHADCTVALAGRDAGGQTGTRTPGTPTPNADRTDTGPVAPGERGARIELGRAAAIPGAGRLDLRL